MGHDAIGGEVVSDERDELLGQVITRTTVLACIARESVEEWGVAEIKFVGREWLDVGRDKLCKLFEHAQEIGHPDARKGMGQS